MLLVGSPGAVAQTPQAIAQTAFASTVTVLVYDASGQPLGLGSGFVVASGQVVTNAHVIAGASRLLVRPIGVSQTHAVSSLLQVDEGADLALLQVDDLASPVLPLASGDAPSVGDTVYAVGSPLGLDGTFSQGIVSGYRTVGDLSLMQLTAPISPGSSGGPVLDATGRVIGVAIGTFAEGQNLNFAVPITSLSAFLHEPVAPRPVADASGLRHGERSEGFGAELAGAVDGGMLLFEAYRGGHYSFSLRNRLPRPIRDVQVVVVFYGGDGSVVDTDMLRVRGPILPGLGERVVSQVDRSVHVIVAGDVGGSEARTRVEIRVLAFLFAD
jgi:S1-C subfamily serine protease